MSYVGYEEERGHSAGPLPSAARGLDVPQRQQVQCRTALGTTARIPCEQELRCFPPIPRSTKEFERLYKGRTAVERVNVRLKIFWGADDGTVTGARHLHAFIGTVMVVHLVFAILLAKAPRWEGRLGQARQGPVAQALRQPQLAQPGG